MIVLCVSHLVFVQHNGLGFFTRVKSAFSEILQCSWSFLAPSTSVQWRLLWIAPQALCTCSKRLSCSFSKGRNSTEMTPLLQASVEVVESLQLQMDHGEASKAEVSQHQNTVVY